MPKWFYETLFPSVKLGLSVRRVLYTGRSSFQKIQVLQTEQFGRMLVLDGVIQTTEKDEWIYHEMLTHVSLLSHPDPKRVLIIGAGDGGILREVLKHPIQEAVLVEIDERIIELSKKYLSSICQRAFDDPRAKILIQDGAKFIQQENRSFDVAIVDSPDPIGPGKVLFSAKFYQGLAQLLGQNGILVRQTGSTILQPHEWETNHKTVLEFFSNVSPFVAAIPTYIGGFFSLLFASNGVNPLSLDRTGVEERYHRLSLKTRYYNPDIHFASFSLPEYIRQRLPEHELSLRG